MDDRPAAPLRVGLEPGYDAGRVGVWLLDVPGAFGWAASRDRALSQTPSIAGGLRDWLQDHGETLDLPPIRGVTIVEEVAPTTLDGYERNATFEADRRPVTRADLARAERWLAYARADLLEVADRVAAHERAHGPLPAEGDRAERASAEVLRHLAGAEVWLTSRVDGSLRFDGPPREGDPRTYLDATRAWMVQRAAGPRRTRPGRGTDRRQGRDLDPREGPSAARLPLAGSPPGARAPARAYRRDGGAAGGHARASPDGRGAHAPAPRRGLGSPGGPSRSTGRVDIRQHRGRHGMGRRPARRPCSIAQRRRDVGVHLHGHRPSPATRRWAWVGGSWSGCSTDTTACASHCRPRWAWATGTRGSASSPMSARWSGDAGRTCLAADIGEGWGR